MMKKLSRIWFLQSQQPLSVANLAEKMIAEAVEQTKGIKVFLSKTSLRLRALDWYCSGVYSEPFYVTLLKVFLR